MSGGIPTGPTIYARPIWQRRYNLEQCEAFATLLQQAFDEYPPNNKRVLARRNEALRYAREGNFGLASAIAINECSLPRARADLLDNSLTLLVK